MVFHEMAEPVNVSEIRVLINRVLVVGNEKPKDVEVILFVRIERGAVEQAVDRRDRPAVLIFAPNWAWRKPAEQREVTGGNRLGDLSSQSWVHSFQSPRSYSA